LQTHISLWELDILPHSSRKLGTYEEIHTAFARYLSSDGIYRLLSAAGNDRYGRTRYRANHVYESPCGVTDALAVEVRLDFRLCENVRADEKLTGFWNWKRQFTALAVDALL
jgi:hypothetical protein